MSPVNSSFEDDVPLSQVSGKPKLKRTMLRELLVPGKRATSTLLGEDFRLPGLSMKAKKCIEENMQLNEATRRQLIRETVTCLVAYACEAHHILLRQQGFSARVYLSCVRKNLLHGPMKWNFNTG